MNKLTPLVKGIITGLLMVSISSSIILYLNCRQIQDCTISYIHYLCGWHNMDIDQLFPFCILLQENLQIFLDRASVVLLLLHLSWLRSLLFSSMLHPEIAEEAAQVL